MASFSFNTIVIITHTPTRYIYYHQNRPNSQQSL